MELNCPIPISDYDRILLAHGGGGKLMHQLIEKMIFNELKNEFLEQQQQPLFHINSMQTLTPT